MSDPIWFSFEPDVDTYGMDWIVKSNIDLESFGVFANYMAVSCGAPFVKNYYNQLRSSHWGMLFSTEQAKCVEECCESMGWEVRRV